MRWKGFLMLNNTYLKRLLLIVPLVILLDQLSKWWLISIMQANDFMPIQISSFFNLVMVWNKGVSFGLFGAADARIILIIMSFMVVISLIIWHRHTKNWICALGVGLISSGALGNVIDRFNYGAVADFLDFHWGAHHWPSFNIADMSIVIGVFLLLLQEFKHHD
jgi:signal peptidase II